MNDLQVECYDAKEVAAKKRSIKKRMAIASGVIVISMGLFYSCGGNGSWYNGAVEPCEGTEECTCDGPEGCTCNGTAECIADETNE